MARKQLAKNAGLSLIEVTLAVAVFAIAIGFTAQALMTSYAALDIQDQRIAGIQSSRSAMNELRERRAIFRQGMDGFDMAGFLTWIDQQNQANWAILELGDEVQHLRNRTVTVEVTNPDGSPADQNSDLLQIQVVTTWTDRMGRPIEARLASMLAER